MNFVIMKQLNLIKLFIFGIVYSIKCSNKYELQVDGTFDISNLNHTQKVLFLVLELESATQADTLLNFFEDFSIYGREAVQALKEVGAYQCAEALNAVVDTLPNGIYPKGDNEFWDSIMSGKILIYGTRQI